jgi:hypothetical protein
VVKTIAREFFSWTHFNKNLNILAKKYKCMHVKLIPKKKCYAPRHKTYIMNNDDHLRINICCITSEYYSKMFIPLKNAIYILIEFFYLTN